MKTRYLSIIACIAIAMPAMAQEPYEIGNLVKPELNGTARYVGMGGALDALGADISVMSSNPAGIGIYKRNDFAGSFGFVSQQDGEKFANGNQTNVSFDQIGFVFSMKAGYNSNNHINFGFNYHKSRNFDYILSAANSLGNSSQNKLTAEKLINQDIPNKNGKITDEDKWSYSMIDQLYCNSQNILGYDAQTGDISYLKADDYNLKRSNTGYVGEYDFNASGGVNNRFFWGVTLGLYDVHYKGYSKYTENYPIPNSPQDDKLLITDNRHITGTGVDVKAGIIFRPIEDSPFRIGLSVASPTYYSLTSSNNTNMYLNDQNDGNVYGSYDYEFYTPWKFGVSLGHTISDYLALGAAYEYADYTSCDARIDNGTNYDGTRDSYSDDLMNDHIGLTMKGVSTFKVGIEAKVDPSVAVRFGYNYVSPMYESNGYRDLSLSSPSTYNASTTDYVNWKAINRITCGLGFKFDKMNLDLAYQYSAQDGDFYPFHIDPVKGVSDQVSFTKVSDKRNQVLVTVGYKF